MFGWWRANCSIPHHTKILASLWVGLLGLLTSLRFCQLLKTSGAAVLSSRKTLRKTLWGEGVASPPAPCTSEDYKPNGGCHPIRSLPPPPLVRPRVKLPILGALSSSTDGSLLTGHKTKLEKKNFEGSNLKSILLKGLKGSRWFM